MFKKYFTKKLGKRVAQKVGIFTAKSEAKILAGVFLTIGTHKAIRIVAKKYPSMRFLKAGIET